MDVTHENVDNLSVSQIKRDLTGKILVQDAEYSKEEPGEERQRGEGVTLVYLVVSVRLY